MENYFAELLKSQFYCYLGTECSTRVLKSIDHNKVYVGIFKDSTYVDKEGKPAESHSRVLLTIYAVEGLYKQLGTVIKAAKEIEQGFHKTL